eukprot:4190054-Pleurochrysis_carterae.AAC.5
MMKKREGRGKVGVHQTGLSFVCGAVCLRLEDDGCVVSIGVVCTHIGVRPCRREEQRGVARLDSARLVRRAQQLDEGRAAS